MIIEKFNDLFALILVIGIMLIWALQASHVIGPLPAEVNGALIATFTLIVQYYFRKRPPEKKEV